MLNKSQIDEFTRDGCLVVRGAVDADTLGTLQADFSTRVDDLLARAQAAGKLAEVRGRTADSADHFTTATTKLIAGASDCYQHLDISLPMATDLAARMDDWRALFGDDWRAQAAVFAPDSVHRLLTHPSIIAIAQQLLASDDLVASPVQHIRIKPPERLLPADTYRDATYARTMWHQDEAVVHEGAHGTDILTVWVAASEATLENGCLRFVPGSHLMAEDERRDFGLKTHCPSRGFVGDIYIPESQIPESSVRALEVQAGDVVIVHRRTVHGAKANESNGVRWSFDLRYQPAGTPTGRECFPAFPIAANDGGDDGATRYRQQWLDARDAILRGDVHAAFNTRWEKYQDVPLCA